VSENWQSIQVYHRNQNCTGMPEKAEKPLISLTGEKAGEL